MTYRLYTFVANHYLSPLQCGLQTAHVVGELSQKHYFRVTFERWAKIDKTIIICAAGNHKGVSEAFAFLEEKAEENENGFPVAIFHEDEQSMNGMATACGIIVPEKIYDAGAFTGPWHGAIAWYNHRESRYELLNEEETALHKFIKGYDKA